MPFFLLALNESEDEMNGPAIMVFVSLVFLAWCMVVFARRGGGKGALAPEWNAAWGAKGTPERPFEPTVSGPGIALDATHNWLWVATDEHGHRLIDKADIRGWKHEWKEVNQGHTKLEFWNNAIVICLADLAVPVVRVSFGRDRELASQWQARLTTWLNG